MGFFVQDDYWESVSELSRRDQDAVIGAMVRLYFTGEETELSGTAKALFTMAKGRIVKAKDASEKKTSQRTSKGTVKGTDCESGLNREGERVNIKEKVSKDTKKKFTPPTPQEVALYANEKGYQIDSIRFCDFYQSKGWMVGKSKMKDWKAAVRNWASRSGGEKNANADRNARCTAYDDIF